MYKDYLLTFDSGLSDSQIHEIKQMGFKKTATCGSSRFIRIKDNIMKEENVSALLNYFDNLSNPYRINHIKKVYEEQDVDNYDFFYCSGQIIPDTSTLTIPEIDYENNESYDCTNYCKICRSGMVQVKPYMLKGIPKIRLEKKKIITPFREFFLISRDLKNAIEENKLTGVDIWPVYNYEKKEIENVYQLKPKYILKDTLVGGYYTPTFKDRGCEHEPYLIDIEKDTLVLKESIKEELLDFNELYERLCITKGAYILSKKMIKVFISLGAFPDKGYYIYPIEFR